MINYINKKVINHYKKNNNLFKKKVKEPNIT